MDGIIIPIFNSFNIPCVLVWNNKTQEYLYYKEEGTLIANGIRAERVKAMMNHPDPKWILREE